MSSFPIIDLVVGMIFLYFILSIISSSAVEMILTGMKVRSDILSKWLCSIFDVKVTQPNGTQQPLGQAIMDHCSITALSKKGKAPSYIDAKNFSSALLEKITFDPNNPKSIAKDINDIINILNETDLLSIEIKRSLLGFAYEAKDTYKELNDKAVSEVQYFKQKVEYWYDSSMDRISGHLKTKYARPATLFVAILTTCLLNADSISIARFLYVNPEVRAKIAQQASAAVTDPAMINSYKDTHAFNADTTRVSEEQIKQQLQNSINNFNYARATLESSMPLGWSKRDLTRGGKLVPSLLFKKITGLLATILAIVMGAPFWFDLLNKISNLRGTGPKPPSSSDDDKKAK